MPAVSAENGNEPVDHSWVLTETALRFIHAYVTGVEPEDICESFGICKRTLQRWIRKGHPLREAIDQLTRDRTDMADACRRVLRDAKATPHSRLQAARLLQELWSPPRLNGEENPSLSAEEKLRRASLPRSQEDAGYAERVLERYRQRLEQRGTPESEDENEGE